MHALTLGLFLLVACAPHSSDTTNIVKGQLALRTDSALQSLVAQGFSGVVALSKGHTILRKGYGWANRRDSIPQNPGMLVQIGSNVKDFTIVGILQLVDAGELSLQDSIARFFQNVPLDKQAITVQQLLGHRAGFGHAFAGGDFAALTKAAALQEAFDAPLRFQPGSDRFYSNVGFTLLAMIIEEVSGQKYEEYVSQFIFAPSGMTETGYALAGIDARRYPHGYSGDRDIGTIPAKLKTLGDDIWALHGNGGMSSTVDDMMKFYQTLFGTSKLLTAQSRALKYGPPGSPQALAGSDRTSFFLYLSEPSSGTDLIIATNNGAFPGPRVHRAIAPIVGIPVPDGAQVVVSPGNNGQQAPSPSPASFPNSPAGKVAREYFTAFAAGPDALRAYLTVGLAPYANNTPSIADRVQRHIQLKGELRSLTVLRVESAEPTKLSIRCMTGLNSEVIVTFILEEQAPHRIVAVQLTN